MTTKLSEIVTSSFFHDEIEEMLHDENTIIDKGYHLEVYGNPDGKHFDSERSHGGSAFVYVDKEITYGEFLKLFDDLGSVKDDTLTIRIIDEEETQEREFCEENLLSERGN